MHDQTLTIDHHFFEWVNHKANERIENFQNVDTVYMSIDFYAAFVKYMANTRVYDAFSGQTPLSNACCVINTDAGALNVKMVPHLSSFCHVGTATTFEQLELEWVGKEFEEIVLKDCEREQS